LAKVRGSTAGLRKALDACEKKADALLKASTEAEAKRALKEWRAMFSTAGKRRTLKRAKPKENPFFVWQVRNGRVEKIGTVKEFKKAVRKERRKGGFGGVEVGALSRTRERRFEARKAAAEASSGKKAKSTAWLDFALKDGFDGYVKDSAAAPGDFPITWKYPAKAGRRNIPDYYLRSSMKLNRVDSTTWELVLKPFFKSGEGKNVLKTLELGGTVRRKRRRKLVGYTVVYYRLNAAGKSASKRKKYGTPGREYGRARRRIVPRYATPVSTVSVVARPFLKALKERLDRD